MAKDYIFGFNPTKVPESFERPDHIPEFIHGPRPNIVPSQDNKVISYYEEIIRLKRAMDALQSELEDIIRSQIPDYDISNANNVLSVNDDGTKMEWKPATSASGVSASVEQTETGATITITDASGTTTATVENGEPGFSPSAKVEQTATGATITVTDKSGTTTADILNGKGEKGDPGFSPSASVTQTETGATVTVTDETGTTTAELKNGKDGVGIPGDDGFSPIANVQQTETGATVTVTDKTGTTTANITNGAPGPIGPSPSVTATATVNESQGIPSVEVTKSGTDEAPSFNFAFSGLKGETGEGTKGDDGFSPIANVQQTDTGATITVTDKSGTTTATIDNGTDGVTPNVSATATVDNTTGTPSVQVTKSGTAEAPAFNFDFSGIKGETGKGTKGDDGFSPIANVQQTETGASITVTDKSGTTTATVENGTKGDPGVTPSITATATVDGTTGTPSVKVTKSGTAEAPAFNFAFTGIKGTDGESIIGPAGPGVPAGGVAGQVLTKVDGTDYNTEWKDPSGESVSIGNSIQGYCEYESFETFTANQRRIVTLHTNRMYTILVGKNIVHASLSWSYNSGTVQFPIQLNVLDWFEDSNGKLAFTVEAYNTASSNKHMSPNTVRYFIQMIDA